MFDNDYQNNGYNGNGGSQPGGSTNTSGASQTGSYSGNGNQASGNQQNRGNYSGYGNYQSYQSDYQYNGHYPNDFNPSSGGPGAGNHKKREKKPHREGIAFWKRVGSAMVLGIAFGICAGLSFLAVKSIGDRESGSLQTSTKTVETTQNAEKGQEEKTTESGIKTTTNSGTTSAVITDVTDVVDATMPSIVSITNKFTNVTEFWGQSFEQEEEAAGSGIIVGENEKELLVVTNNHVVQDATSLSVQFIDDEVVEAQIKGTSPSMDLAVVAVKLSDIKESTKQRIAVSTMGDSDSLKVGEPVIAIGNALGYGQSVTTGVVSALNRTLEVSETGNSNALIQTDAAINPGNSGGALLDVKGQVIGINSNKIGGSTIEGMGYAIPISSAKPIIEQLMNQETKEKVAEEKRGYLGISCINVTASMAKAYSMPEGIYVAQVYAGTGADAAGLVKGDIITGFGGNTVSTQDDLQNNLQYYAAGDSVEVTIMHGNPAEGYEEKTVSLVLSSESMLNTSNN